MTLCLFLQSFYRKAKKKNIKMWLLCTHINTHTHRHTRKHVLTLDMNTQHNEMPYFVSYSCINAGGACDFLSFADDVTVTDINVFVKRR